MMHNQLKKVCFVGFFFLMLFLLTSCDVILGKEYKITVTKYQNGLIWGSSSFYKRENSSLKYETIVGFIEDGFKVQRIVTDGGEEITSDYTVKKDININVYFVSEEYCATLIRHNPDEKMEVLFTYGYSEEISTAGFNFSTEDGYIFVGWSFTDGGSLDYPAKPNETLVLASKKDISLYAVFLPDNRKTVHIVYENADNLPEDQITEIKFSEDDYLKSIYLPQLEKEGYSFEGWFENDDFSGETFLNDFYFLYNHNFSEINNEIKFYARWSPLSFDIELFSNLNGSSESNSYTYGSEFIFPECTFSVSGYDFIGWGTECDTVQYKPGDKFVVPASNVIFYAIWQEKAAHKIIYVLNYGEAENVINKSFKETEDFELAAPDGRKGYTFQGWYLRSDFSGDPIQGWGKNTFKEDVKVYAKWMLNEYTITYAANGGTYSSENPVKYSIETGTVLLKPASKDYYEFKGWTFNNKNIESISYEDYQQHLTLTAVYTPVTYTIKYNNLNEASFIESETYTVESSSKTLQDLSLTGYIFEGWFLDENFEKSITSIPKGSHGDITLYAKWSKRTDISYKVIHSREKVSHVDEEYLKGTTLELTEAVAKEYEGYTVESFEQLPIQPNGSTVIYINYKLNKYTISFISNGGDEIKPWSVSYNSELYGYFYSFSPTRKGYKYDGLMDEEGNKIRNPEKMPAKNLTFYINWTPIKYYIYYSVNGSTQSESFTIEDDVTLRTDFTKTGYEFNGWSCYDSATNERIKITGWNSGEFYNYLDINNRLYVYADWIKENINSGTVVVLDKQYSEIEADIEITSYSINFNVTKEPDEVNSSDWYLSRINKYVDEVDTISVDPRYMTQGNHTVYVEFEYHNRDSDLIKFYSATYVIKIK